MARFKNKDIHLLQDEELLLGNAQDASVKYDGSDLVINKVPYHTSQGYLATQEFVNEALLGLDWQNSVLSRTTDIPGVPLEGDRYIIPSGASGAWSGLDDTTAEYTTTWVYTTPSAGFTTWVEDEGVYYTYNNSWVKMGTVVDHSNLLNLDVDDHTQYLNVTRHDLTARHGSAVVDHGLIGGLGDDDHSIYLTTGRHDTTDRHGSSVVDHGSIGGLDDDDHTQYLPISGGRAMTGDLDLDSYTLTTTGYVSAGTLYGDGSSIIGLDTDHGNLTGLTDDDHIQYLHTDGRRPWDGTLTVASTGSQIQFTEDFAYIGVSSNTDLMTLAPTGVTIDGNISATTFGGAGFDHDLITNTHDLTTDIDHDAITNAHNLTTDIDHASITNAHNLTTDIDHNSLTNTHNLNVDIDHGSIGGLADDDHPQYFLLSSAASVSGDILAATAGLDIGSVGTPFSDIYCDTLHTSAGSVIIGTTTLTEVGGVLISDSEIQSPTGDYITTSSVTFETLDGNSDVGTASTQVAQGDHSHGVAAGISWTYGSQVATNSGTTVVLTTSIPSSATDFEVMFNGVGTNTNGQPPIIQLGDAGGYETSGYSGGSTGDSGDGTATAVVDSGIQIWTDGGGRNWNTADAAVGIIRFSRWDSSEFLWVCSGGVGDVGSTDIFAAGGGKATSQVVTSVRLNTNGGAATFDAGEARVRWR